LRAVAPVALLLIGAARVGAAPNDLLGVGEPLYEEVRLLETSGAALGPLPFLTRPWSLAQLDQALGAWPDSGSPNLAWFRLARGLERDRAAPGGGPRSTPRLFARVAQDPLQRLEASLGVEGLAVAERDTSFFASGSGVHARLGASLGGWTAYSHLMAAHVPQSKRFADPLIEGEDFITHTEESYLAYTGVGHTWEWSAAVGRSRFAWGPGLEGSLLLSAQAPPLSALWLTAALPRWRVHVASLAATLASSAGEQLAAHRIEWEARPGLRLGLSEAARYRAAGWQALYLAGVVPYTLVQRLQVQDEPDSAAALRNNVLGSADFSWRLRPGARLYGELLLDDLRLRTARTPTKLAYQVGWEGVGAWGSTRLAWGGEWTRLSQFVYTSQFGRSWASQGVPLGYALGPDARRVRVWAAWDVSRDWQLHAWAARTDKGENGLDQPFVPDGGRVDAWPLSGQVERSREIEGALRWWPASGVDLALLAGGRWIENAGHVPGVERSQAYLGFQARVLR
jgi:hypothetical protein